MKRTVRIIAIATLAAAAWAASPKSETAPGPAAFARLKTLVGDWQADTEMGKVNVSYEVIAGGTSLVERITGEKMGDMLTVYYLDGDRLLLTHYCHAGNQPRMQARSFDPATGEIDFRFLDATNLTTPAVGHMHNATFYVTDGGQYRDAWEFYENGQRKLTATAQYTRIQ